MIHLETITENRIRKEGLVIFSNGSKIRIDAVLSKLVPINPNLNEDKPLYLNSRTPIPKWSVYTVTIDNRKQVSYYCPISENPTTKDIFLFLVNLCKFEMDHNTFFQSYNMNPELESSHLTYRRIYREKHQIQDAFGIHTKQLKEVAF